MIIVVGAGIAGIACARELQQAGRDVTVLDRGRRIGGRLAVRSYDGRPVDIGGSYFTVTQADDESEKGPDAAFAEVVADWQARGLARPWTDTFSVWSPEGERTSAGPVRWASPGGLRSLVEDLAAATPGLQIVSGRTVGRVDRDDDGLRVDGQPAEAVVVAMPDPQARRLLGDGLASVRDRLSADYDPVIELTAIFGERSWPDRDGIFVNDDPVLAWVADDGLRRGDRAPVLVAHSTPDFARPHLENPAAAAPELLAALRRVIGSALSATPEVADVHRWTFAKPSGSREQPYLLTPSGLGVCGDGWAVKSNVQAAYRSGWLLGQELGRRSSGQPG